MSNYSFGDLEAGASEVIEILKTIPEFSQAKLVVIGGLALWKYLQDYRTTEDIDFFITVKNAPPSVKATLLKLPNSRFVENAQYFSYETVSGKSIQVDMIPEFQTPYYPSTAQVISTIPKGTVPYITVTDLITFKINSCGLRAEIFKKRRDATDALTLTKSSIRAGGLSLTTIQKEKVLEGIEDVIKITGEKLEFWKAALGI